MIEIAKQLPLMRTGATLLRSLVRRSYHTATIRLYGLDVDSSASNRPGNMSGANWNVGINQQSDLDCYDPNVGWQNASDFRRSCADRITRGDSVFTINVEQTLVHYGWLSCPTRCIEITEVDQTYVVDPGAAYLYDFFTHPAFRNRGMYQASMRRILDYLPSQGRSTAYIGVAPNNVASCRAIEKLGFLPVATLGYRRIATNVRRWVQQHSPSS